jgi:replicative DNA helicase
MDQLVVDVNRLVREAGLRLLLIDSLQWMTEGENETSPRIEESTLRRLKRLAETAKIAIIITANAGGRNWAPMSSFTHGAAIEQVSDVAILLDRVDQDGLESPRAGEADLIVAKNRNGPTATVTVACQLHYCRFVDMAPNGYA